MMMSLAFAQDAVSDYATRRLDCWTETQYYSTTAINDDGTISTHAGRYKTWGVKDGRGTPLDTASFAKSVGDVQYLGELETKAADAKKSGRKFIFAGLGIGAIGGAGAAFGWLQTLDAAKADPPT